MCTRLRLQEIPNYSAFVKRTVEAIARQSGKPFDSVLSEYEAKRFTREAMQNVLTNSHTTEELSVAMRRLRRDVLLTLALRDVAGEISYEDVVRTMSDLAEVAVERTVRLASEELSARFGVPTSEEGAPEDLLVVAMGKLGGRELNVSSDIDLVFLYDEGGKTRPSETAGSRAQTIDNHEFFERLARRVIVLLHRVEAEGFVFRVDTRLRPFGESGPIVVSAAMLEEYLYREGRDWERFAWLKARVINRPVFMTEEAFSQATSSLYSLITPFVYRKYVDFGVLASLSRVHEMIRAETIRRELGRESGINVKLGRGGIREIEFIVQTFQVMRGGRDPQLRGRETLPMLRVASEAGCLAEPTAKKLAEDYIFLRNTEHALQYVDDRQTHFLADGAEVHEKVAAMLGLGREALEGRLKEIRDFVSATFDAIFETPRDAEEKDGWPVGWKLGDAAAEGAIAERLKALSISRAEDLAHRICRILSSRALAANPASREQFCGFLVTLAENATHWAEAAGFAGRSDVLLERYLNLLELISGRTTYLTLLNRYRPVAVKVARLLLSSQWASTFLCEHPVLLDELVDSRADENEAPAEDFALTWEKETAEKLASFSDDIEALLNVLRDSTHAAIFRLLIADLQGLFTVERLADRLSDLADAVLRLVMDVAWKATPARHREKPKFAVIGYGKLGGKELGYASDLDLVFLYEDDAAEAAAVYARFARRIISYLTVQTSSGKLYAVDTRLRPEGEDGLLVCSFEHFKQYEENEAKGAWIWEHQALTRARFCAGDPSLGRAFEEERVRILRKERDANAVREAVVAMRRRILETRRNNSGLFDLKRDRGAMVDVEFAVQTLILSEASRFPKLTQNLGNAALLKIAADLGLLDRTLSENALNAYRRYRDIQRRVRLDLGQDAAVRVDPASLEKEREAVLTLWRAVLKTDEPHA